MCGIAAIYHFRPAADGRVDTSELDTIVDHMRARGPDGRGSWLSDDGRVGLGHRRLSIIDLSDAGAQPMATADGQVVVSFNGEIYNHALLRQQLLDAGRSFRSTSDTEVLLQLYLEHGTAMFERLRGMYAFAIWDGREQRMLLARDPQGIKPLYYADDGDSLRVASQVKALLAGGVSRRRDPGGVVAFYSFGNVPEPWTRYADIRALPAGSYALVDHRGVHQPRRHWSIAQTFAAAAEEPRQLSGGAQQDAVREALIDTVRHHLVADVPVGAFLSSGVDSGALVALMSQLGGGSVQTVTLAFDSFVGKHHNEAPLAEQLASRYGTTHTTCVITPDDFAEAAPAVLEAMDQPSVDGINTWLVSRAAADMGLKVAVSGLGGDELFGGYPSFWQVPRLARALRWPARVPGLGRGTRHALSWLRARLSAYRASAKTASLLEYGGSLAGAYFLRRGLFMPWELPALLGPELAAEGLRRFDPIAHLQAQLQPDPGSAFGRMAVLEASMYMTNQLLRDSDWASMAHSLEVRVPLVDRALTTALAPLLVAGKRLNAKRLLAQSPQRPLPRRIITRPKTGFSLPIGDWLLHSRGGLDAWRAVPALADPRCHWSRRLAYTLDQLDL